MRSVGMLQAHLQDTFGLVGDSQDEAVERGHAPPMLVDRTSAPRIAIRTDRQRHLVRPDRVRP
ncbi:protein of unknown function (plasmid) [Shinella sp. WSC3-e]|nr:protein of unknown function [Shinella sp. WSC3-e]